MMEVLEELQKVEKIKGDSKNNQVKVKNIETLKRD
jgi:hypothetical protein